LHFIVILTTADIGFIPVFASRTIELGLAFVAIGALGVVLTILTDATAIVMSMDVQR